MPFPTWNISNLQGRYLKGTSYRFGVEIHNQSNNHRWIYKKVILGHLEKFFFQRKSARETMSNIWPECKYHDFRFSIKMPLNKSILDLSSNLRDFQPFFGFISLCSMNFKTNNFEMQTAALWSKKYWLQQTLKNRLCTEFSSLWDKGILGGNLDCQTMSDLTTA